MVAVVVVGRDVVVVVVVISNPISARRFRWKSFCDSTVKGKFSVCGKIVCGNYTYQRMDLTIVISASQGTHRVAVNHCPDTHRVSAVVSPLFPAVPADSCWSFQHTS